MKDPTIFEAHTSYVLALLFTSDSRTLVSAGMDSMVKLWLGPEWPLVKTLEGHAHSVNSLAFSPDGRWLAGGAADRKVRVWGF